MKIAYIMILCTFSSLLNNGEAVAAGCGVGDTLVAGNACVRPLEKNQTCLSGYYRSKTADENLRAKGLLGAEVGCHRCADGFTWNKTGFPFQCT